MIFLKPLVMITCEIVQRFEKKCEMLNPVIRQFKISALSKTDSWANECISKDKKEDPDMKFLMDLKESSSRKPEY